MAKYVYQYEQRPRKLWDDEELQVILGKVRHLQGKIFGKMEALGFSMKDETMLATLTMDLLTSSEIEAELLNYEQVRLPIAHRLGMDHAGMVHADRNVEGVVDVLLVATQRFAQVREAVC